MFASIVEKDESTEVTARGAVLGQSQRQRHLQTAWKSACEKVILITKALCRQFVLVSSAGQFRLTATMSCPFKKAGALERNTCRGRISSHSPLSEDGLRNADEGNSTEQTDRICAVIFRCESMCHASKARFRLGELRRGMALRAGSGGGWLGAPSIGSGCCHARERVGQGGGRGARARTPAVMMVMMNITR